MERNIADALRTRTSKEWGDMPNDAEIQETYKELLGKITQELLKGNKVAFIRFNNDQIPNKFNTYSVEISGKKIDVKRVAEAAKKFILQNANQYKNPDVELAIVDHDFVTFPFRPDLNSIRIKRG